MSSPKQVALVGFGAIGKSLLTQAQTVQPPLVGAAIRWVVVRKPGAPDLPALPAGVSYVSAVPNEAQAVLEVAGHSAVTEHVLPALQRGVPCAMLSIGALADDTLAQALRHAALAGGTQLSLLPGALGGVDAMAAAQLGGLSAVRIVQSKPPKAWKGTAADKAMGGAFDLDAVAAAGQPVVLMQGSARESATRFPKNANITAMVALATLGLDNTQVQLVADPTITKNAQAIEVSGAFGVMKVDMSTEPLPDNPRTSALVVLSALRWLRQFDPGLVF